MIKITKQLETTIISNRQLLNDYKVKKNNCMISYYVKQLLNEKNTLNNIMNSKDEYVKSLYSKVSDRIDLLTTKIIKLSIV